MELGFDEKKIDSIFRKGKGLYRLTLSIVVFCFFVFTSLPYVNAVPISIQRISSSGIRANSGLPLSNATIPPGCRYKAESYLSGDDVPTDEPCLRCLCKRGAVVCKLRICTERMPDAPPPGCVVVQRAKSCCPKLVCPEGKKFTREQRLSTENNRTESIPARALLSLSGKGFCVHEGSVYGEGSAMKSNIPCNYCFCIRGEMKCSKPQCVIPLNGCKPRYRSFACCPTNYDCSDSNRSAIVESTRIFKTTPMPLFLKGCRVLGRFIYEGEPVLPIQLEPENDGKALCQTCFCLGGIVRCRPLECDRPIPSCKPITQEGYCCPTRYECETPLLNQTQIQEKGDQNLHLVQHQTKLGRETLIPEKKVDSVLSRTTPLTILTHPNNEENATHPNLAEENEILFNRLRSDIGSREERRNKDKEDLSLRTSYEDDERDYLFGIPSLESIDHELISKLAFHGTTEIPEEKGGETFRNVSESSTLPIMEETEIGDGNEISETTVTALSESEFSFAKTQTFSELQNGNITEEREGNSTLTSNGGEEIYHASAAKSNISQSSTSSSSLYPASRIQSSLNNLEFIPFGVEDAVLLPPVSNMTQIEPSPSLDFGDSPSIPIKSSYDEELGMTSLIPPTPSNQFNQVGPHSLGKGESLTGRDPIQLVNSPQGLRDNFRNVIMDVPVSTSLFTNGFYHNGIITNSDSNSSFPGHAFEGSGEELLILNERKDENRKDDLEGGSLNGSKDDHLGTKLTMDNPSRTYSKFEILDSPTYRQENGEMINTGLKTDPAFKNGNDSMKPPPGNFGFNESRKSDGRTDLESAYENEPTLHSLEEAYDSPKGTEFSKPISLGRNESENPIRITSKKTEPKKAYPTFPNSAGNFKPVVAFPFRIPPKRKDSIPSIGLKLSGCNIYGNVYKIGSVIRELSGACVECQCTEMGVQCSEIRCELES